jgi:hypothetical protein
METGHSELGGIEAGGTWKLVAKGRDAAVFNGTWHVAKRS